MQGSVLKDRGTSVAQGGEMVESVQRLYGMAGKELVGEMIEKVGRTGVRREERELEEVEEEEEEEEGGEGSGATAAMLLQQFNKGDSSFSIEDLMRCLERTAPASPAARA